LGADPGLRIYNGSVPRDWAVYKNPDNITQDEGLLLEGFFEPLTVALAGKLHSSIVVPKAVPNSGLLKWEDAEDRSFQYAARVGSKIGNLGTVNGSYILQYRKTSGNYDFLGQELVAVKPDAEVYTHLFGIYTSVKPAEDLDLTIGYAGIYTKYLNEFYRIGKSVETLVPAVLQNGINLNARYTGISKLSLRTDHNVSFWIDRDYSIFGITGWEDSGLLSQSGGATSAELGHLLLWNGAGAAYELTRTLELSIYVRNLYRSDTASNGGTVYALVKDQLVFEPKLTFKPNEHIEMYGGITFQRTATNASEGLNNQGLNSFIGVSPRATADAENVIKIPIGIMIKY
jgi:hypothetical protein